MADKNKMPGGARGAKRLIFCSMQAKLILEKFAHRFFRYLFYFSIWRASEASETLSGVTNENRRYIYIYKCKKDLGLP